MGVLVGDAYELKDVTGCIDDTIGCAKDAGWESGRTCENSGSGGQSQNRWYISGE